MGSTRELGESPNLVWNLKNMDGIEFEDWIFSILTKLIEEYFKLGVKIEQTPRSGDNGKDIIITSPVNLKNIFYQNFSMKNNDNITIYVECKSTDSSKLRFDKIISNVIRAKYDHIDYFVLITNATIIPDTYHKIYVELKQNNIDFILIDQYLLAKTIHTMGIEDKDSVPLSPKKVDFCGQYQVFTYKDEEEKTIFDIPILFRNYTSKNRTVTVKLYTDENWEMIETDYSLILPPYGAGIKRFKFKHISYDGVEELKIYIKNQDNESIIPIEGANYKEVFFPPFVGTEHQQILENLENEIKLSKNFNMYYLWGETGIGKSRIIIELFKLLSGTKYDLKIINLSYKVDNPIEIIQKYLLEKKYITDFKDNLYKTLQSSSNNFRKAVIVIEDLHYANKEFLEQLKLLDDLNVPIFIIACGRNDYSSGNLDYFSFIQWTLETHNKKSWEVNSLLPNETKKLIRIMINGIPEEIVTTIQVRSSNNPLYIVQYIEYLLETNMVQLQNRNTVGILNIDTFPTKRSIPEGINAIYKKRLEHLIKTFGEETHLLILLLLTTYKGEISLDTINNYLDLYRDEIKELINRRLIKYSKNKTIQFVHESLYVFFKNIVDSKKKYQSLIAKIIIENSDVSFSSLSDFEIGKIFIWANNTQKAKQYFKDGVNEILNTSNYSNISVNIKIYEFLYCIYKLYYKTNYDIAKKALICRIYMSLHYFAPMSAVEDCKEISDLISKSDIIKSDKKFINAINSLKAHAFLNSGHLDDGELVLKELLSEYLISSDNFNKQSLFDIIDRLASVYIKYNCFNLANNYVKLEMQIAEEVQRDLGTKSLLAIAHRTRSKLFFFQNKTECLKSLEIVKNMPDNESSNRIYLSNQLSQYIYNIYYNDNINWLEINKSVEAIRGEAVKNSFDRVLVRSDMLLSVCAIKLAQSRMDLTSSRKIIERGINESIRLGIPGYIWQFYNLLAIVDTRLEYEVNHLNQLFETIYAQLFKQNLLYVGNQQLCFCNLLAISNIGAFLYANFPESRFKDKMANISYTGIVKFCNYNCSGLKCSFICLKDNKYLNKQYKLAKENKLLFTKETQHPKELKLLRDDFTHYFIPIS